MPMIEVFFDLTCPFSYRGYRYLMELLPQYPGVQLTWKPVEAHPRLQEPWHKPYVDLAVQGALFVQAMGGDQLAYHDRIFRAHFQERRAVDDIEVLTDCARELGLPAEDFRAALTQGTYVSQQLEANEYAFGRQGVWAVPTFVCGQKRLDAVEGVGVSKAQVQALLEECGL